MRAALAVAVLLLTAPDRAGADHDHHHGVADPAAAPSHRLDATVAVESAVLVGGSYQGVTGSLAWRWRRIGAAVAVPWYRLHTTARTAIGLGDVVAHVEARLIDGDAVGAGVIAAFGLPTGDADDRLGMGHPMAMPGAWLIGRRGQATLLLAGSLGLSLDTDDDHLHAPALVSPMNRREVGVAARLGQAVSSSLTLHGSAALALPIGDDGARRATAGLGATWQHRAWTLAAEVLLGIAGDSYRIRTQLGLGRAF